MKKILYSLVIITIFLIIPNAYATELLPSEGFYWDYAASTFYQNGNGQNVPKSTTISSNGGVYGPYALNLYLSPSSSGGSVLDAPVYSYLYIDVCNNLGMGVSRAIITNSTLGTNYLQNGTYSPFIDTGACTVGNTALTHHQIFEIPIGRWNLNEYSGIFEVSSYLQLKNNATYSSAFQINYMYLSDEKLSTSQELLNKLNSINTAITNMQNSINSNANTNTQNIINNNNTNTQNIINNQNQNQAQNHQDSINTQNKIDDLNDSVTDDNVNSNTGKSFFDNFSDNTHGLSGIITAPLNIIQQLINVNPTSCSALSTTYHNKTISMECGQIFWGHTGFSQFNVFYNMVVGGAFCYLIIKDLFLTIEKLKDPDNDKVEVMDL